jgi:hypothetical protein
MPSWHVAMMDSPHDMPMRGMIAGMMDMMEDELEDDGGYAYAGGDPTDRRESE